MSAEYNLYEALEEESKSILCPRHAQLCRDARAMLAERDAEIEKLRVAVDCDSCGASVNGTEDNHRCRGCGLVVCDMCINVFRHFKDYEHGTGDPTQEIERMHETIARLQEKLALASRQ